VFKNDIERGGEAGERNPSTTRMESVFRDRFQKWRQQRVAGRTCSAKDEKESNEAKASTSVESVVKDEDSATLVGSGNILTCHAETCVVS